MVLTQNKKMQQNVASKSSTGLRIHSSLSTTMLEIPNLDLEIFHRNEDEKQLKLRCVLCAGFVFWSPKVLARFMVLTQT